MESAQGSDHNVGHLLHAATCSSSTLSDTRKGFLYLSGAEAGTGQSRRRLAQLSGRELGVLGQVDHRSLKTLEFFGGCARDRSGLTERAVQIHKCAYRVADGALQGRAKVGQGAKSC